MDETKYLPDSFSENRFKQTSMMKTRPQGWLVMDSWNNESFPMDIFSIDTMKFNTKRLSDDFHQRYGGSKRDLFLPWHYVVELVDSKPFVIQTRPIMYKSGIPGFKKHLTIMLIGDGNQDIYSGLLYKMIAHTIINPMKHLPSVRAPNSKENFTFQTGKNFDRDKLLRELQRDVPAFSIDECCWYLPAKSKQFVPLTELNNQMKDEKMTTKHTPTISDIQIPGQRDAVVNGSSGSIDMIEDLQKVRKEHNVELTIRKRELLAKVADLEKKLSKNERREGMLDRIITETYVELDNLKENEFTRRGQKQSILIKQLEALSILQSTLLSYEDMIFKYQKILLDLENNKLNSFLKIENLKKEEKDNDDNIAEIMQAIQEQLTMGSTGATAGVSPLIDEIKQELADNNY